MSEPIVSVVLPTYNEAQSLPVVVPRILDTLQREGIAAEVIVVDDDSPDGTAAVARELASRFAVRTLHRTKERGLATAVLAGFAMSRAPVCVVMDADGSHPVEALPGMARMIIDDKCDVVVGSRHVTGGGSHNWPVFSQLKSKLAAALTFGITSMTDPTTGFMAIRRNLLEGLALDPIGWKIVLEIVVKAAPVRVAEVPIVFSDRELGESKQSLGVFWQYVEHLGRLYGHRYPALVEFLKFCIVGLIGVAVDLSTVLALKEWLTWDTRLCAVGGFSTAVTTNFLLNRNWTFRGAERLPLLASYATFVGASLLGLSVRMLVVHGLIVVAHMDEGYGYLLSNLIGIGFATLFNFVGAKFFAFDAERLDFARADEVIHSPPQPSSDRPLPVAACAALLTFAAAYAFATGVLGAQLSTDDEGVNVTMARNILASRELLLRPSVVPGGFADWRGQDLPLLGNTPFFAALLALGGALGGLSGMAALGLLAFATTLFFTHRLLALDDRRAAWMATVLMAVSPTLHRQFALIELEPVLTAFCAAGLYWFVRGARWRSLPMSFLGGALLGLGFLTKLWLVAPYAFAAVGFLVVHGLSERARHGGSTGVRHQVIAAVVGFALFASAHLTWVAWRSPIDLGPWLRSVYLGIFSGHGVTGAKLSAVGPYAAVPRPVWFYPLQLYRDHLFLVPLCLFGLPALGRRAQGSLSSLLAMLFAGTLGVVILSIPAVKEPLYVLAVTPFLYMTAGLSLSALSTDAHTYHRSNVSFVKVVNLLCVTLLCATVLGFVLAPSEERDVSLLELAAPACGLLLPLAVGTCWMRGLGLLRPLIAVASMGLLGWVGVRQWTAESPPYAELATTLDPILRDAPPAHPSFVAPHSRILMGYLHRAGRDWGDAPEPGQPEPRAFVVAPLGSARSGGASLPPPDRLREVATIDGYRVLARR